MRRNRIILLIAVLFVAMSPVTAVELPAVIGDGMVLQRDVENLLWGTAEPATTVTVTFLKKKYTAVADDDGAWTIELPAVKYGGPYDLTIDDIVLHDIYVGDLWLCSGQSNMELPVARVMEMFADEVNSYENAAIRQLLVPRVFNFSCPQSDIPAASWIGVTPETAQAFSALGYFFAKQMYETTGIPQGIINASWGGTPVEAWMSEDALQEFPLYTNTKMLYDDSDYLDHIKALEAEQFSRWYGVLYRTDEGLHADPVWYDPSCDDSEWRDVELLEATWGNNGLNPLAGSHWLRRTITLSDAWDGAAATLRLGCIIDADSVYVNGTLVGTTSYQYPPRIYPIPSDLLHTGDNNITIRVISNGSQPSFVREKRYSLTREDGEEMSLEGIWKYHLGTPMPVAPSMKFFCYEPVGLYNAMIAPLHNLCLSGVLWYQGEANVSRRNEYVSLLTAMIADWRRTFDEDELPFYIVELADFLHPSDISGRQAWQEMRIEQARTAQSNDNTYIIHNADLGEWNDIHPLDKKSLSERIVDIVLVDKE